MVPYTIAGQFQGTLKGIYFLIDPPRGVKCLADLICLAKGSSAQAAQPVGAPGLRVYQPKAANQAATSNPKP